MAKDFLLFLGLLPQRSYFTLQATHLLGTGLLSFPEGRADILLALDHAARYQSGHNQPEHHADNEIQQIFPDQKPVLNVGELFENTRSGASKRRHANLLELNGAEMPGGCPCRAPPFQDSSCEVQLGQRVAAKGMAEAQKGQVLVVTAAAGLG